MGQLGEDDSTPVGQRLGSERLYDEHSMPPPIGGTMPPVGRGNLQAVPPPVRPKTKREKQAKQPPTPPSNRPAQAKQADENPRDWRGFISSCLEVAGIVAITAGCAFIALWLALVVGGILLAILGVATGWNVVE